MAQADQTVQNDTFPNVRSDINSNLAALFSNNSGNSAPTTTVAHMDWIDSSGTDPVWKKRNAANSAWITVGTIKASTLEFSGANVLPTQSGNSGKYLTTDGTTASWGTMTGSGRLLRAPQILTSGTSYTTPADCNFIYVEAVGGGGGGGSADLGEFAAGGGAGGYCAKYFTVSPSTAYTYAIGAGGAGATVDSTAGAAGGNTTFTVGATTITAGGGGGGSDNDAGGSGGTCTNGDLNATGSAGMGGSDTSGATGALGGSSFFGGAGRPTAGIGGNGSVGGGGAGGDSTSNGGNGGAGLIRIWEYS